MNLIENISILVFLFAPSWQLPTNSNDEKTSGISSTLNNLSAVIQGVLKLFDHISRHFKVVEVLY